MALRMLARGRRGSGLEGIWFVLGAIGGGMETSAMSSERVRWG